MHLSFSAAGTAHRKDRRGLQGLLWATYSGFRAFKNKAWASRSLGRGRRVFKMISTRHESKNSKPKNIMRLFLAFEVTSAGLQMCPDHVLTPQGSKEGMCAVKSKLFNCDPVVPDPTEQTPMGNQPRYAVKWQVDSATS